jgi:hypothetical protein
VVTIDPNAAAAAFTGVPSGQAAGSRVAVLDSGDVGGQQPTMVDLTRGQLLPSAPPDDLNGHGTAVAALIKAIESNADVYPVRVVDALLATSYQLLCGLAYALWSQRFDVVNVSLSAHAPGGCPTVLGTSLEMILQLCQQQGTPMPLLVAAAGNTPDQRFAYPAQLPGALVVLAWDWAGQPASYNVTVPLGVTSVFATGGDAARPFGSVTPPGQVPQDVFGTSFAAAVVTARLL